MTLSIDDVRAHLEANGHQIKSVEVINKADGIAAWQYDDSNLLEPKDIRQLKLLIFTPLHPNYGIKPQTLNSIQAAIAQYDGPVDWLMSANDNPSEKPYENVVSQHNKARRTVLEQGYDALLSIEADMIIPPDTVEQLLSVDADIVYGLYVWRHKPRRWNVYKSLNLWGGESVSFNHNGQDAREAWGKVIDVAGLGMGCTLIRKNVLRRFQFRIHDGNPGWIADEYAEQFKTLGINPYRSHPNMVCDDWLLAMDAQHYQFSQKANLNIVCGHILGDEVIWPDPNVKELYRVEQLEGV